jgi:two-component system response regulator HydG
MRAHLLVVDNDAATREALHGVLSNDGHACELVCDAQGALQALDTAAIDAVVCEVHMEGMNGFDLLDRVKRTHPSLPFILTAAVGGISDAVRAIKRGAFHYLAQPWDVEELRSIVATAIASRPDVEGGISGPTRLAAGTGAQLVGAGETLRALQARIDRVAVSSAPVLITGETGVGKEVVARAIHARGERRARPFVAVNMSAIPESLLESEVFGHVRGAFTSAGQPRKGLLTEADGGTILLDEIGDMPLALQAKLLRVLQFGDVRPVGGDKAHPVDVRIIAATHRDLPALIRKGHFRADLFFRLDVLPVFVAPLRDHREDIPALAARFLAEARQRTVHSPVRSIGPEALRMMIAAPWPGNVRELASVIERAVVFGSDVAVGVDDISCIRAVVTEPGIPWPSTDDEPWTLRRLSHVYTEWVLDRTSGNKQRAAEVLGIDLSTLYRWQRAPPD